MRTVIICVLKDKVPVLAQLSNIHTVHALHTLMCNTLCSSLFKYQKYIMYNYIAFGHVKIIRTKAFPHWERIINSLSRYGACFGAVVGQDLSDVRAQSKAVDSTLQMAWACSELWHWYTQMLHSCWFVSVVFRARRFFPAPRPSS